MQARQVLQQLKALSNPANVAGMARYGVNPHNTYGVSIPHLRAIARQAGQDHRLALELWTSGIHEARILAALIDDPARVTEAQMERWVRDLDSWDVCDQVCNNLFVKTRFAYRKADWSRRKEEFVKRAGFVLMTQLAVRDKSAGDAAFSKFLPLVKRAAADERNFVKRAINWALRQIGKRNRTLNRAAIKAAREMQAMDSKSARWIAADALRELTSPAVQNRLHANRRK